MDINSFTAINEVTTPIDLNNRFLPSETVKRWGFAVIDL